MNKWFNEIFMPSIFQRAGVGKSMWLSQKQTAICTENMKKETAVFSDGIYTYKHLNYSCVWNGRKVNLSYSKKNGCGSIIFGLNDEEQKRQEDERKEEKKRLELDSIERAKRHPERLEKRIATLRAQEKIFLEELSDDENDAKDIEFFTEKLNECRRLLALYKS